MRRTTAISFASALLAGVATAALTPPGANAQQMQPYAYNPQAGGPPVSNPYHQPYRQYGQVQQFGPEDFGQAGRYQHYGSRSQYGFAPYDPDERMLQYGMRQQYGFPPYREGGGAFQPQYGEQPYGQQYGQAMPGGDYRGPQGFDDYALGQPGYAQGGDYRGPRGADTYGLDQRYAQGPMGHPHPQFGYGQQQYGQFGRMPQQQAYDGGRPPEETYARETRREVTGMSVPDRVLVTSANDLVGRTVRDMNGNPAGQVEFIMVDARSGDVSYAILGTGRGLQIGADYVAVPWSAITVQPGDAQRITLKASRDRLMQAPRLSQDDLAALASPAVLTRVTEFYGVPAERAGQAGSAQAGAGQARAAQDSGPGGQQQAAAAGLDRERLLQIRRSFQQADQALGRNDTRAGLDELGQIGRSLQMAMQAADDPQEQTLLQVQEQIRQSRQAVQNGNPQQAQQALRQARQPFEQFLQASIQPKTEQQATGQQATGQQATGQPQQPQQQQQTEQRTARQGTQDGAAAHPAILIGRRVVSTLQAPALLAPTQLRGNAVMAAYGEPVGEIDQVMLDLQRNHVAYVLLASGGFLGMDEVWIPVPFESLNWSSEALGYVLDVSPRQLAAMPVLRKEELPTSVSTRQLAMLYRHYGETPYWQKPTVTAVERGAGGGQAARGEMAGLSPDDVRQMLSRQGFSEVSDLARDGDTYQATARMDGQQYDLTIDLGDGLVIARGAN